MHDLPSSLSDNILRVGSWIAFCGLAAFAVSWNLRSVSRQPRGAFTLTQRLRYTFLGFATLVSFGPAACLLAIYGWSQFDRGMSEYQSTPGTGWLIFASVWFGLFSPIMTILTAFHIYRHPCYMAKRFRGGLVTTQDVRSNYPTLPIHEKASFGTSSGAHIRCYRPTVLLSRHRFTGGLWVRRR